MTVQVHKVRKNKNKNKNKKNEKEQKGPTTCEILRILGDKMTLDLLDQISRNVYDSNCFGLSRRQYYNRIHALRVTRLVRKKGNSYRLTSFGEAVYNEVVLLDTIMANWSRFTIMDVIAETATIPVSEKTQLWERLMDPELLKRCGMGVREVSTD